MSKLGRKAGRKATKATVKHSARGVASKAKRQPLRSVSLLSVGGALGAAIGWFAGRKTASA
jgi:hypothetical protein